eukprot:scaffold1948_cov62-Phaeocystis_antarctica.AAC.3
MPNWVAGLGTASVSVRQFRYRRTSFVKILEKPQIPQNRSKRRNRAPWHVQRQITSSCAATDRPLSPLLLVPGYAALDLVMARGGRQNATSTVVQQPYAGIRWDAQPHCHQKSEHRSNGITHSLLPPS